MANRGYDVVVDVDAEVCLLPVCLYGSSRGTLTRVKGDLGHTDLQEDLEFHSSSESQRHSNF